MNLWVSHPWWTAYGVIAFAMLGVMLYDLWRNRSREPADRVPPWGYVAWTLATLCWPILVVLFAIIIATGE